MKAAHAELEEGAEQGHFLCADLASAEEGDAVRAMPGLDGFHSRAELEHGGVPINRLPITVRAAKQWRSASVRGGERCKSLPPFWASHSEVYGIMSVRGEIDRLGVLEVDVQSAAGRAETANHAGHLVGRETARYAPRTEPARFEQELASQRSIPLDELVAASFHRRPPGIREAGAARKKR